MARSLTLHFLVLLVSCCILTSSASPRARGLLIEANAGSSSTAKATNGGTATASSSAISTLGSAFAESFASSMVKAESASIFKNVTNQILENTEEDIGNCTLILQIAETEVNASATAVAAVYVEAFGSAEVDGDGEACAQSEAAGEATATAFAEATGNAIVDVLADKSQATAEAIVNAAAAATANAFADAFSEVCTSGGFGLAEQTSFAEAIVRPMVEVYAFALGGSDCADEARAESIAKVGGNVTVEEDAKAVTTSDAVAEGKTNATTGGDAGASTEEVELCTFPLSRCCRRPFENEKTCDCRVGRRSRCDAKKLSVKEVDKATWEDIGMGKTCTCR